MTAVRPSLGASRWPAPSAPGTPPSPGSPRFATVPVRSFPAAVAVNPAARSRGGKAAMALRRIDGKLARLDSAAALLNFAGGLVHKVAGGEVDPDTARAAFYGISVCRQLVEVAELEARVKRLQAEQ
jgi:hypothetical protein